MIHIFLFIFLISTLHAQVSELETIELTTSTPLLESEVLAPVPILIIDEEKIKQRGALRLQDALYLNEGISFVKSGTKLAPSVRGFSPEHTLFLIDGQRLANEPTNKYDLERLELINIERIEVTKGPLSTAYGADALGGVVNLITRKKIQDKVSFSLRNATYDFKSPRNSVGAHLDKKINSFGISLFGTKISEDPLYYNKKESIDDKKDIDSYGAALIYTSDNIEFSARHSRTEDRHESLYYNFLNSNYVYDDDHHIRMLSNGKMVIKQDNIKHIGTLAHSSYTKEGFTHLQSNDNLLMSKIARIYVTEVGYKTEITSDYHLLTIGLGHRKENFIGNAFNYKDHSRYLPEYYSLYVIDQWALSDRLILMPSLRQEKINYFDDKTLGQFGITYSLDETMKNNLKFNFAQGYRVPTPKDLFVDVMVMKGNPNLSPETSNSYNLEYNLVQNLQNVRAGLFVNEIKDLIKEYYDPSISKYTYQNVKEASIVGTELFYRRLFKRHENSLSYTYLEAREEDGPRLPNRARHHGIFNTTYFMGPFSLSNDISCRANELLYNRDNELNEFSYCSFDAGLRYQQKSYQVLLKGNNLMNNYTHGATQMPRVLAVALNVEY